MTHVATAGDRIPAATTGRPPHRSRHEPVVVVVPVGALDGPATECLASARTMGDRVVAVHVVLSGEDEDRAVAVELRRRWRERCPEVPLVMLAAVDERGLPSRVLGPAIAGYLRVLGRARSQRVLLLVGEEAPARWWQRVLPVRRGAVLARYAGRHSDATVNRLPVARS